MARGWRQGFGKHCLPLSKSEGNAAPDVEAFLAQPKKDSARLHQIDVLGYPPRFVLFLPSSSQFWQHVKFAGTFGGTEIPGCLVSYHCRFEIEGKFVALLLRPMGYPSLSLSLFCFRFR